MLAASFFFFWFLFASTFPSNLCPVIHYFLSKSELVRETQKSKHWLSNIFFSFNQFATLGQLISQTKRDLIVSSGFSSDGRSGLSKRQMATQQLELGKQTNLAQLQTLPKLGRGTHMQGRISTSATKISQTVPMSNTKQISISNCCGAQTNLKAMMLLSTAV